VAERGSAGVHAHFADHFAARHLADQPIDAGVVAHVRPQAAADEQIRGIPRFVLRHQRLPSAQIDPLQVLAQERQRRRLRRADQRRDVLGQQLIAMRVRRTR
jgi:hypothetical protein